MRRLLYRHDVGRHRDRRRPEGPPSNDDTRANRDCLGQQEPEPPQRGGAAYKVVAHVALASIKS